MSEGMRKESIMVTGAEGFIGTNLVKAIRNTGKDVIPVDYKLGNDLLDKRIIDNLPQADVVVHLAGKTFVPSAWEDPFSMYDININTTLNMLEYARRRNVKKFIFPSTYVYGEPQYVPVNEKHPLSASNPYTRSKLCCEDLCKAYCEDFNIPTIILRLINVYGRGQAQFFLIPTIISQLSTHMIALNDSRPKRDYVYVSDVIRAFQLAIDFTASGLEVFNIGSGISHQVTEVVDMILKISGVESDVFYKNESKDNNIMDTIVDISKAQKILKWNPRVTFEKGLRDMIVGEMRPRGLK